MIQQMKCGLVTAEGEVPLDAVRVEARLSGASVEVTVTQRYRNRESIPVEAVYVFPLEERAAVCGFAAVVGGSVIRGRVEGRDEAFAEYDDAMARGDGAFLLDQERPNVFTASVGNLPAGAVAELQIRYVTLVTREGDATRLTIPTTVSPRYVPAGPPEVGQPDGERVNPPHWPSVPYGLTLKVDIDAGVMGLRRVESPSHPIRTTWDDGRAIIELSHDAAALDRDFVLLVEGNEPARPEARVAREPDGRRVVMVTFLPQIAAKAGQGHEVTFLLDCSGSMAGESLEQARRALALCVRALTADDTFNVVRFGSTFQSLWKTPRKYDDESLDEATAYIGRVQADLGGTEILAPLTAILEARPDPERPRRVLLLTDGQVSNEDQVLAVARQHAGVARIFAFGIGAGASEHLVRGTARASRGASEMIFPGERIEPKVLRTFERVRMPAFDDVRVDWKGLTVEQAPSRVPPVFGGDSLTIFARVESGTSADVELTFGEHRFVVPVDLERAEAEGPIPILWAREAILELEDTTRRGSGQKRGDGDERRRARLVELGKRYGLLSSVTSFVAVGERTASEQTTTPSALRRVPVALTSGWSGGAAPMGAVPRTAAGMALGAPPPMMRAMRSPAPMSPLSSAPSRPLVVAAPPSDPLFDVLMTQSASGSFSLQPVVLAWLGDEITEKLRRALAKDERVAVTAIVVVLLERDHLAREAEWRPAANKAKAWLAKQPSSFDVATII